MAKQIEVPGTERKYSKAMRDRGDELQDAIKAESKAKSKRKEREASALQQMRDDGVDVYVDSEADPPFQLVRSAEERIVKKAYKPPPPIEVDVAEESEQQAKKKRGAEAA